LYKIKREIKKEISPKNTYIQFDLEPIFLPTINALEVTPLKKGVEK
jgi:hypothetical protein